jgi:hypothetical protein
MAFVPGGPLLRFETREYDDLFANQSTKSSLSNSNHDLSPSGRALLPVKGAVAENLALCQFSSFK